jgi:hypothetical protein
MINNRQALIRLEKWILSQVPANYKAAWVNIDETSDIKLDCKLIDAYQKNQSIALKQICLKNNIPFITYTASPSLSDKDRLSEYSKFLIWKSENYNTILFSKLLKEHLYFGEYKKYSLDNLDYYPFINFTQSQVDSIVELLLSGTDVVSHPVNSMLEWLYMQDVQFKVISSSDSPTKHSRWGTYSLEQKSVIAKYFALARSREHKIKNLNTFNFND